MLQISTITRIFPLRPYLARRSLAANVDGRGRLHANFDENRVMLSVTRFSPLAREPDAGDI